MRCKHKMKIETHRTRDEVSPAVANGPLRVALFRPGTRTTCKCMAEGSDASTCDALYVMDADGNQIATFHGTQYRAADETNSGDGLPSGICIYATPTRTSDEDRLSHLQSALVRLNQKNAEFWRSRYDEE
jgi:hypothetical protein